MQSELKEINGFLVRIEKPSTIKEKIEILVKYYPDEFILKMGNKTYYKDNYVQEGWRKELYKKIEERFQSLNYESISGIQESYQQKRLEEPTITRRQTLIASSLPKINHQSIAN